MAVANKPNLGALFGSTDAGTFLGIDACDDLETLKSSIALFGAPGATPYRAVGSYCAEGPAAIRQAMAAFTANREHHDFDCGGPIFPDPAFAAVDCGDLGYDDGDSAANRKTIRDAVAKTLRQGAVPILLGGDDSVPIPMLQGFSDAGRFSILQIDAHIDWRDSFDGERLGLSSTMRRASEMDHIISIVQVGQRGIGSARPEDVADAKAWGAKLIGARELHREGAGAALQHLPENADVIVCLDCDGLDPSIMPGVISRAPGGLTYWQIVDLLEGVAAKGRIAGLAMVEFMPQCDVDGIGALTAGRIVATAMGLMARQAKIQK